MNPDGYAKDEPFPASLLEQPTMEKNVAAVSNASNGITSVNGLNGVNDH